MSETGDDADRLKFAVAGECGKKVCEFDQADFGVANGEPEAVFAGIARESGDSPRLKSALKGERPAEALQEPDGGNIEGTCEGFAHRDGTLAMARIILWAIRTSVGGKFDRDVRQDRRRGVATLEGEEVGDGLDRRACGTRHGGSVYLAGAGGKVVAGANKTTDFARAIIEHNDCTIVDVMVAEFRKFIGESMLDEAI